ncbi:MAG: type VII secretion protein EssB [Bacillus sp. (in: firmicutes)]
MPKEKRSYIETQTEASVTKQSAVHTYVFQRALLKLKNELEVQVIKELNPNIHKTIEVNEDEIIIRFELPEGFSEFDKIHTKTEHDKWVFVYRLIQKAKEHSYTRLIPIISPENVVFDNGYTPYLLHYGIKNSIPPYEVEPARLLKEAKAIACAVTEGKHSFIEYLNYEATLKLSKESQAIMSAETMEELEKVIGRQIQRIEEQEKQFERVPKKKWSWYRYSLIAAIVLFVPVFAYMMYSLVFLQPKQEAYVESQRAFLEENYSEVATVLESYDVEGMPYVIKYQLATAYVVLESLQEDQREIIFKSITLQTDEQLLLYWIYIGRGMNEEALELARVLEDRDLIMLALFKYQDEVKADDKMKSDDKQALLDSIDSELDDFEQEIKQEEAEQKEEQEGQQQEERTEPAAGEADKKKPAAADINKNNKADGKKDKQTDETEGETP